MEIKVFGHKGLETFLKENSKQYDCVYYTPSSWPELEFVKKRTIESLHLPVDDLDHYDFKYKVAPTASDVKRFLDFTKDRKKLLVACRVGVCRSSATAYLIAARELGAIAGLEVLNPSHHSPNRLIVFLGSKILNNHDIWLKYVQWMETWTHVDPSQGNRWPTQELISKMGFDKLETAGKV